MSGGVVKASPRHSEENPQELKAQEGIEGSAGLTPLLAATDRCLDQYPEGGASGFGTSEVTRWEKSLANDIRVRLVDEKSQLGSGESP
jgi:hypothetical protein